MITKPKLPKNLGSEVASFLALVVLSAFALSDIMSRIKGQEYVQIAVGTLFVLLLVKTVLKR